MVKSAATVGTAIPPDSEVEVADPPRRRRWRPGFRLRVFGLLAVLLTGAIASGLVIQRAVLRERLDRQIERNHEQERSELERLASGRDPASGRPFDDDVEAIFTTFLSRNLPAEGEVYLAFVNGELLRPPQGPVRLDRVPGLAERWAGLTSGTRGSVNTRAGEVRWLAVPLDTATAGTAGVFVIATFVEAQRQEIDDQLRVEAAIAALLLLVSLAVAYSLAGRLLRPVRQLTDNARSLSETDLSARIADSGDDEIAELARTYNAMLDRLQVAFETQRRFVDDAGHELRTPITIIRGHLELMDDDPDEQRLTVALMTDELDRMARMVDDLLVLALTEQPQFIDPAPVDLGPFTVGLLERCRPLGDREWRVEGSATGVVLADAQRLTQALLNLSRNAVEHTATGSPIALGSALYRGHLHLWIRDTGPGVPADERDRLFERFARGATGRGRSDGAGLGLAIVRGIAEAHGGRASVECPEAGGSVFTISVPVVDAATTPTGETASWPAS